MHYIIKHNSVLYNNPPQPNRVMSSFDSSIIPPLPIPVASTVKLSKKQTKKLPMVSICVPTFNRRPFIPFLLHCYRHQTYPKDKMELIVVDDGTDSVADLLEGQEGVVYVRLNEHVPLGKKRNIMHTYCKGEYIVYMDDDDYYPPERVAHAIEMLQLHPRYQFAGSCEMFLYHPTMRTIFRYDRDDLADKVTDPRNKPLHRFRSTAASFAFHRNYLQTHRYDETKSLAEEASFLDEFRVPILQLDSKKTILVFSHLNTTVDRDDFATKKVRLPIYDPTPLKLSDFIRNQQLVHCYEALLHSDALIQYKEGFRSEKKNVLEAVNNIKAGWNNEVQKIHKETDDYLRILSAIGKVPANYSLPPSSEPILPSSAPTTAPLPEQAPDVAALHAHPSETQPAAIDMNEEVQKILSAR